LLFCHCDRAVTRENQVERRKRLQQEAAPVSRSFSRTHTRAPRSHQNPSSASLHTRFFTYTLLYIHETSVLERGEREREDLKVPQFALTSQPGSRALFEQTQWVTATKTTTRPWPTLRTTTCPTTRRRRRGTAPLPTTTTMGTGTPWWGYGLGGTLYAVNTPFDDSQYIHVTNLTPPGRQRHPGVTTLVGRM
jgi:hypothetical protein